MFGQGFNVGILATYAVADPTITLVSRTDTTITFTIKNNDSAEAVINYEQGDSTPDATQVTIAAGATSSNLSISSLSEGTSYTIYAQATITNITSSAVVSLSATTLSWQTLGSEYDKSDNSSSPFGTYLGTTWWMPVFNNSSVSATNWQLIATSQKGDASNEYWTRLHVEDSGGTTYNDDDDVTVSMSGYITTYINNPSNALENDSNFAASISAGNHVGSAVNLQFSSAVTLNKLWIRTSYTKIDGMTLKYLG